MLKPSNVQVDQTVFRVNGHLFERESDEARALIRRNAGSDVIHIRDITSVDLARFLKVLYCK
jgi:hypothetical protein